MTGILPLKKYGEYFAINIFDEYSMIAPAKLAEYLEFTKEAVCDLCEEEEYECLIERLKK